MRRVVKACEIYQPEVEVVGAVSECRSADHNRTIRRERPHCLFEAIAFQVDHKYLTRVTGVDGKLFVTVKRRERLHQKVPVHIVESEGSNEVPPLRSLNPHEELLASVSRLAHECRYL